MNRTKQCKCWILNKFQLKLSWNKNHRCENSVTAKPRFVQLKIKGTTMDQYLSTYKKDYVWPSTRMRHAPSSSRDADPSCLCKSSSRELKVINLCGDAQDWSRIGPMGRLLDAKLYPAKTGPSPESEATKFDQPSTYMKKVYSSWSKRVDFVTWKRSFPVGRKIP